MHLHVLTTYELARTSYMRSTCKYGLRSISWQSQGDRTLKVRCKHVKLTRRLRNVRCMQLLTAKRGVRATYLDLAQSYGRRALTYSVPAIATPSPRFQKNVADVASARNVRTKNTHGGLGPGLYSVPWNSTYADLTIYDIWVDTPISFL